MRTTTDALRSLKRYVAIALGADWEVRLSGEEGAFERPFCRVSAATGGRSMPFGPLNTDLTLPCAVVAYPHAQVDADHALLEGQRVAELLHAAFARGVHEDSFRVVGGVGDVTVMRAHPARVPLYDYAGVSLDGIASESMRDRRDFMRVANDVSVDVIADPNSETLVA